jgi:ADP-ribosylglycohydrolase
MTRAMLAILEGATPETVLTEMQAAASRYDVGTATMIGEAVGAARDGTSPEIVLARLQGWAAHEAIAAAAFVFARHPDSPRQAMLEAVNSPGDSDSLGTLVGALTGARSGIDAIPDDWCRDVERSGELLALADEATQAFGP